LLRLVDASRCSLNTCSALCGHRVCTAFIGGPARPEVQLRWRRSRYLPCGSPASVGSGHAHGRVFRSAVRLICVPSRATLGSSGDLHAVDAIASRWLTSASSEGPVRKDPGPSSCACHPARHRAALPFAVEHPKRGTPCSPPGMGVPLPTEGEPHARSPCEPRLAPRRCFAGWLRACPDVHSARTSRSGAVEAIALRPRAVRHGT